MPGPSRVHDRQAQIYPPTTIGDGIFDITLKKGSPNQIRHLTSGEPAPGCEWDEKRTDIDERRHTMVLTPRTQFKEHCHGHSKG